MKKRQRVLQKAIDRSDTVQARPQMSPEFIQRSIVGPRDPAKDVTLGDGRMLKHQHTALYGVHPTEVYFGPGSTAGALKVLATAQERTPHGPLTHVSFSYARHLPSWRDTKMIRKAFFRDDVDCMMMLPVEQHYINDHPFCLHIFECPEPWRGMGNV